MTTTPIFMRAIAAVALAAGLAAPALAADKAGRCDESAVVPWTTAGKGFTVEAVTFGPDCENAVATIVVRSPTGLPLWVEALTAQTVMVLAGKANAAEMKAGVAEWLDARNQETTADLPEWKEGADQPMRGEFPFYPEFISDREEWNTLRAAKKPMLCYGQGMESLACIIHEGDDMLTKVGVQSFPG